MFRHGLLVAAVLAMGAAAAGFGAPASAAAAAPRAHPPVAARKHHAARQAHHAGRRSNDPSRTHAKALSRAADPTLGVCTAGIIFNVAGSQQTGAAVGADAGNLYSLNVATGANTLIGRFSSGGTPINGLGVTRNLSAAYAVAQNAATGGQQIYTFTNDGATSATTSAPNTGLTLVMGAVDPANGIYYYAGYTGSGATLTLAVYGYNPATNTPLGRLVNVSLADTGFSTGDLAFDGNGNMYIVTGTNSTTVDNTSEIRRVNGPLPTSGPTVERSSTTLAEKTAPAGTGFYNGIAFEANGTLYAQYATSGSGTGASATPGTATLQALDPGNAATLATISQTGLPVGNSILTDLAGCSFPGTLTLRKDLPSGRAHPDDQFRMQITGGDITEGNRATTAGTASGVQPQHVGPLPARPSTAYTIRESLAPGSPSFLSDYDPIWSCVNTNDGAHVASGSGASGTVHFPALSAGATEGANVVCTFTNRAPGISIVKTAFPTEYGVPGEVITYSYRVTNTSSVPLHNITVTDSRHLPVSCPYTTLAPGASMICHATHTTTAEDVAAGHIENAATATGHPPTGPPVTDRDTETVHRVHRPAIQIQKTASPPVFSAAGQRVTFTYQVVNTGISTLRRITVTDSTIGPVSCPRTTLEPGEAMFCHATYITTAADVATGAATNIVVARGYPPTGPAVSGRAEATIVALPLVPVTG